MPRGSNGKDKTWDEIQWWDMEDGKYSFFLF